MQTEKERRVNSSNRKKVLCPIQNKSGKTYWMRIGAAFENRDGSWNVHLDALPQNGKLQIRDLDERDQAAADRAANNSNNPNNSNNNSLPF